jgi:hypothetical protein
VWQLFWLQVFAAEAISDCIQFAGMSETEGVPWVLLENIIPHSPYTLPHVEHWEGIEAQ